ncbi:hypothetical protein Tco_0908253 [Tanacetum coccineum]|uniref:Uncharacterized protein n=1 Tax=Tanacetum coccineum TaxID=301880 RepID=A0ABQ5CNS1_9ASTR
MSTLTFDDTHNMVAFLEQPVESDGFHEIINFLSAKQIYYALIVNPIIRTSCIEQFLAKAKANTVNGERQLQAIVDKKRVIIKESSIRSDLQLADAGGIDCLPTATIFEEQARMGAKSTAHNEFSSTMASAIICLATNQKFNFSKYIFDAMISEEAVLGGNRGRNLVFLKDEKSMTVFRYLPLIQLLSGKGCSSKGDCWFKEEGPEVGKEKEIKNYRVIKIKEREDAEMFDIDYLHDDEVIVDMAVGEKQEKSVKINEREVSTSVEDSTALTILVTTADERS